MKAPAREISMTAPPVDQSSGGVDHMRFEPAANGITSTTHMKPGKSGAYQEPLKHVFGNAADAAAHLQATLGGKTGGVKAPPMTSPGVPKISAKPPAMPKMPGMPKSGGKP